MKDSTRIDMFYFDDNFRRIALWVSAFTAVPLSSQGINVLTSAITGQQ